MIISVDVYNVSCVNKNGMSCPGELTKGRVDSVTTTRYTELVVVVVVVVVVGSFLHCLENFT